MSETTGYAVPLAGSVRGELHTIRPTEVDVNATYAFSFLRRRWFGAAGQVLQGTLVASAGYFLLTQIDDTPKLAVQIAIVGGLLALGGLAFIARAVADLTSRLTINRAGIRGRFGLVGLRLSWPEVEKWRVHDHGSLAEHFGVEIWTPGAAASQKIPSGYFDRHELQQMRRLLAAFALGHEEA
jgi:hypothetical protein